MNDIQKLKKLVIKARICGVLAGIALFIVGCILFYTSNTYVTIYYSSRTQTSYSHTKIIESLYATNPSFYLGLYFLLFCFIMTFTQLKYYYGNKMIELYLVKSIKDVSRNEKRDAIQELRKIIKGGYQKNF